MASKDLINLGTAPDSGTGDSARRGGQKINNMFADIYSNLGDNPIGNDPNAPFYGYRREFEEFEYKVGEIHAAGKYTHIVFRTQTGLEFDTKWGYGVEGDSESTLARSEGRTSGDFVYSNAGDAAAGEAPKIFRNTEWYFLSRGELISADLTSIADGGAANLVLPLARPGDVIVVKDTLGTWTNKRINIWTTPYEFQDSEQLDEWERNTVTRANVDHPDSDFIGVRQAGDAEVHSVPYKRVEPSAELLRKYPSLMQPFDHNSGNSPVNEFNKPDNEIRFTYRGDAGWVYTIRSITGNQGVVDTFQDRFNEDDWIEWDDPALTIGGSSPIEIQTGHYILPVLKNGRAGTASGSHVISDESPQFKVYRRMGSTASEDSDLLGGIVNFLEGFISGEGNTSKRHRAIQILGYDSDGTYDSDGAAGFGTVAGDDLYKEVTVPNIVDTKGSILLISAEPFSGYTQLIVTEPPAAD